MEMIAEPLIHCIYASAANAVFSDADLAELLRVSRVNNARLGLSGMLLYADSSFFQVLEGRPDKVDELFEKISKDKRHSRISVIIREPIPARNFAQWTMGYSTVSREDIEDIDGLNDVFGAALCFAELDGGRAKKLLNVFAKGRWRLGSRSCDVNGPRVAA